MDAIVGDFDLSGQVALVTGSGRGIGTGVVEVFAEAGCAVAVNALTPRYVEPLAERVAGARGQKVVALTGDVTKPDVARDVVERTVETFGRIDILVNGLGDALRGPLVALPDEEAEAASDERVREILDINLLSAIHCTRAAGRHLLAQGHGRVITISGAIGLAGRPGMSLYGIAKHGLTGLTRALALEWAPYGIRVNAIAPGQFPDHVTAGEDRYAAAERRAQEQVPLRRVGQHREVGLLALYLAAQASDYMTGQVLTLDGGLTL